MALKGFSRYDRIISGWLPIDKILNLGQLDYLHFARPAYVMTHVGLTTSQGDEAILSDVARSFFSVDGTGVLVGTLSDSYNCLGSAATDVINGDLPRWYCTFRRRNQAAVMVLMKAVQ